MTISIPDTLTTDNSEKYIVSIRLRSGGLSFSGYDPSAGGSFFYRETEFDRAVSFISSLKEFFFAHEFLTWTYKRINVICVSSGLIHLNSNLSILFVLILLSFSCYLVISCIFEICKFPI